MEVSKRPPGRESETMLVDMTLLGDLHLCPLMRNSRGRNRMTECMVVPVVVLIDFCAARENVVRKGPIWCVGQTSTPTVGSLSLPEKFRWAVQAAGAQTRHPCLGGSEKRAESAPRTTSDA